MPIKSFRGQIKDLDMIQISLKTNNGSTGYKIKKFELMSHQPGQVDGEHVVQVFSIAKTDTSLYDNVSFEDQTLLAAGYLELNNSLSNIDAPPVVVFDNVTFNQDIYITHADVKGSLPVNYHIELEQVKLSLDENTVATLKDIRNIVG